jgi:excinuclease UvrABC nuclease subunit
MLDNFNKTSIEDRKYLPATSAVYVVTSKSQKILYVGQTTNLQERWRKHERADEFFKRDACHILWQRCQPEELKQSELRLIQLLNPTINTQMTNFDKTVIRVVIRRALHPFLYEWAQSLGTDDLGEVVNYLLLSIKRNETSPNEEKNDKIEFPD